AEDGIRDFHVTGVQTCALPILDWPAIDEVLGVVRRVCEVRPLTIETHDRGLRLARRYQLAVYDAMIAASALEAGCDTLWTEDLQIGRASCRERVNILEVALS